MRKKLSLTEEKRRSRVLKVTKPAYNVGSAALSYLPTARDHVLDGTIGWFFPTPDALEYDFND